MSIVEKHPWNYFIPKGAETLIIGTFPPTRKNWSFDFFYPNKMNLFWGVMSAISGIDLKAYSDMEDVALRKHLLETLKAGITDMGKTILRNNDSSLDENLDIIEYMDIEALLQMHPSIEKIIFTSSSGRTSAAKWFENYLFTKDILFRFPKGKKPLRAEVFLAGRRTELVILYSPSRRAANRITSEELTRLYRDEIVK